LTLSYTPGAKMQHPRTGLWLPLSPEQGDPAAFAVASLTCLPRHGGVEASLPPYLRVTASIWAPSNGLALPCNTPTPPTPAAEQRKRERIVLSSTPGARELIRCLISAPKHSLHGPTLGADADLFIAVSQALPTYRLHRQRGPCYQAGSRLQSAKILQVDMTCP
jgi:hypothetical protein